MTLRQEIMEARVVAREDMKKDKMSLSPIGKIELRRLLFSVNQFNAEVK
jgi:hypothetical protein